MPKPGIRYVVYPSHPLKDGSYPIKIKVTHRGASSLFNSGLVAQEEDVNAPRTGDKTLKIKNTTLRRKAEDLVRNYEDVAEELPTHLLSEMTAGQISNFIRKASRHKTFELDFPTFAAEFITRKDKNSHQAALNYRAAVNHLSTFLKKKRYDISLVTSSTMRSFEEYLVAKFGRDARAISLYTGSIRTIFNSARHKYNNEELGEIFIKNTFGYYEPPKQPAAKHRDVEPYVIQAMIDNYHLLKGQERVAVAMFLLSFALMGMNTPDIYECGATCDDILHYCRHKTRDRRADNAEMFVKIPSCIQPLIVEYADKDGKRAFNFYHRYSCYKNLQDAEKDGIKPFKQRIGYKKAFTNYSARHTWATIARSAACKVPLPLIDDCLDHASSTPIGDIYAKKDYSVLWEVNEKVLGQFNWDKLGTV